MHRVEPETDTGATGPFGSRFVGVGIGLAALAVFVMLPFLIPVTFYVVANVYALIKGTTFSSGTANDGVILCWSSRWRCSPLGSPSRSPSSAGSCRRSAVAPEPSVRYPP
jgi:hypothetical protein